MPDSYQPFRAEPDLVALTSRASITGGLDPFCYAVPVGTIRPGHTPTVWAIILPTQNPHLPAPPDYRYCSGTSTEASMRGIHRFT